MLRREGWPVNRKRVRRLYRLQGLQVRMRVRRRKHMCLQRGPVPLATRTHERWSMEFATMRCSTADRFGCYGSRSDTVARVRL